MKQSYIIYPLKDDLAISLRGNTDTVKVFKDVLIGIRLSIAKATRGTGYRKRITVLLEQLMSAYPLLQDVAYELDDYDALWKVWQKEHPPKKRLGGMSY